MLGLGSGGTGCWINPEMQSHSHPIKRLQYEIYKEGSGMVHELSLIHISEPTRRRLESRFPS